MHMHKQTIDLGADGHEGFYNKEYFEGHTRESPPHTRELIYPWALRTARFLYQKYHPHTVLDIGCAKGYLTEAFLAQGIQTVWGVDISWYALTQCERQVRGRLAVANAQNGIPIASDSCDLITALDLFEHLPEPSRLLKEIRRVLSEEGVAYLKICHPDHPNALRDPTHVNVRQLKYWKEQFEVNGLRSQRVFESELTPREHGIDTIKGWVRQFREWAVIGTPADYKFLVWKSSHG